MRKEQLGNAGHKLLTVARDDKVKGQSLPLRLALTRLASSFCLINAAGQTKIGDFTG